MDLTKNCKLTERLAAAELARIVEKHDIRWDADPKRLYPVAEVGWIPAGWLPMVERLIVRMIALGWNRRLADVKEKFGGLRFYVGKALAAAHAAIERAERRSLTACETCGGPGRQRKEDGTAVRCEKDRPKKATRGARR